MKELKSIGFNENPNYDNKLIKKYNQIFLLLEYGSSENSFDVLILTSHSLPLPILHDASLGTIILIDSVFSNQKPEFLQKKTFQLNVTHLVSEYIKLKNASFNTELIDRLIWTGESKFYTLLFYKDYAKFVCSPVPFLGEDIFEIIVPETKIEFLTLMSILDKG